MARYALVVGISQYQHYSKLTKTTTDAEAVARVLETYGNFTEVKRFPDRRNRETSKREIIGEPVTGASLGKAIQTLLLEQAHRSEALLYFTGHGIKVSENLGQPRGYLAASDCEVEFRGEEIVEQKYGIPLDGLNELISRSELSSLVVILDCCHSGQFIERNLLEHSFNAFRSQKDYYLITACRNFQVARARQQDKHSVFTGALLNGLSADNTDSDGEISGERLFDCVSRELKGSQQEPIKLGWGRSICLVAYPLQPPTIETSPETAVNWNNPYLGLKAFEQQQADYFFGRERAIRASIDRLQSNRFLAVIGPSGCGKSSLVKAGLIPALHDNCLPGSSQWPIRTFTPGTRPLEELEKALTGISLDRPFLLFIDQLEEVFTLCDDEAERCQFVRRVMEERLKLEQEMRVVVAVRGDFLDRIAAYEEAAILINKTPPTTYFVTPLTPAELEQAIVKPAQKQGVRFELGLEGQIISDVVDRAGALPLLQ